MKTEQIPAKDEAAAGGARLFETDLFLSFASLCRRLVLQLRAAVELEVPAAAETIASAPYEAVAAVGIGDVLLDCFLLAVALNQILEDRLHRDVLGLRRASTHLPPGLAGAAAAMARLGFRARAALPSERRLAAGQRGVEDLVAALARPVADALEHPGRQRLDGRTAASPEELLERAEAALAARRFPRRVQREVQRVPNCFRAFDQQPADCLRLVERFAEQWPDRGRRLLVVGIRTSGSYLAPLYVELLHAAGYQDVSSITIRPQHFVSRRQSRLVRSVGEDGGLGLIVDDPPRTGTQLDQTVRELRAHGLPESVLLLQTAGGGVPERLRGHRLVLLPIPDWSISARLRRARIEQDLAGLLVGKPLVLRGTSGTPLIVESLTVERVTPLPERRGHVLARIDARVVDGETGTEHALSLGAEGVGLGYFGRHEVAVADAMPDAVPRIHGVCNGLLIRDWLPERERMTPDRLIVDGEDFARAAAQYVVSRGRLLSTDEDVTLRLAGRDAVWEHVAQMLGQAFGRAAHFVRPLTHRAAKRLTAVERSAVADARTGPAQWFGEPGGHLRKTHFEQRASSNEGFQSCDPVFDLAEAAAGAAVWGSSGLAERLRREYEALAGEPIDDERWTLYRLLHHLAAYRSALVDAARDPQNTDAFARALHFEQLLAGVQRRYVAGRYLDGLEVRNEGALCALDIDGVLETRWVAFPAISGAGALALRSLNLHGYRAVLVTGRSLGEVRDRCVDYRLAGGVAEYGSVIYDHGSGSETSMLDEDDVAALERLRRALRRLERVHVDPSHRYAVRAHFLSAAGERSALPRELTHTAIEAAGVEGRVRVISGELQTDVVAAGVDKGRGLRALAAMLDPVGGGSARFAMAVGDTAEDNPMLELAENAYAPANASGAISERVRRTRRPYQAGLLQAVERMTQHSVRACETCRPPRPRTVEGELLLGALGALDGGRLGKATQAVALAAMLARRRDGRPGAGHESTRRPQERSR